MRKMGVGRSVFAASMVLAGALSIAFRDFALVFGQVPKTVAAHDALAMASGAILLLGGMALLVPWSARIAALLLALVLLLFLLLLRSPGVVMHPLVETSWYGAGETLTMAAGAWTVFSTLPARGEPLARVGSARAGQIAFALALIPLGLAHVFYLGQTAPLIPPWLPFHVPLAYATGAAHIAAGLGMLLGVVPRLAATLEAVMVSLFTLIIWVPAVIAAPKPDAWTELAVSAAISGAAWAVAESFRATARHGNGGRFR
ncbi:MAG TPA: hypothetical protein VLC74_00445 [Rhizomicrobium sp.]|nr:hypothetical protein [Rhizomicrobium sp.]